MLNVLWFRATQIWGKRFDGLIFLCFFSGHTFTLLIILIPFLLRLERICKGKMLLYLCLWEMQNCGFKNTLRHKRFTTKCITKQIIRWTLTFLWLSCHNRLTFIPVWLSNTHTTERKCAKRRVESLFYWHFLHIFSGVELLFSGFFSYSVKSLHYFLVEWNRCVIGISCILSDSITSCIFQSPAKGEQGTTKTLSLVSNTATSLHTFFLLDLYRFFYVGGEHFLHILLHPYIHFFFNRQQKVSKEQERHSLTSVFCYLLTYIF